MPRNPRTARKTGNRSRTRKTGYGKAALTPLWLFLCEPGLGGLLLLELKFRDVVGAKTRATTFRLRNQDLLVIPAEQVKGDVRRSRIALHVLACPVFGRSRISPRQLDDLAAACLSENTDGLVSSTVGDRFQRQDLNRWITRMMGERGVEVDNPERKRPVWLLVVDDKYWFGFEQHNYHDLPGRDRSGDREASLPSTIGAAMAFAAHADDKDVIWDPVVGSGALLRESREHAPGATLIGSDVDGDAVKLAEKRLGRNSGVHLLQGDGGRVDPGRNDVTLTLANLPWGHRFAAEAGNEAFYADLIRNSLAHAAAHWRGCFLSGDPDALEAALADFPNLNARRVTELRVRGRGADMWLVERRAAAAT